MRLGGPSIQWHVCSMSMQQIDLTRTDLNLLVVFEALMAERHVGRAAARLCLSQSATSHALGRLRDLLGDPLFVRHPRGVEPTTRARALAAPIAEALTRVRAIVTPEAPFDPARLQRSFRIAAHDFAVLTVLVPLMAELRARAPGVDLRTIAAIPDTVVALLDRGELDFALGVYPEVISHRIQRTTLFTESFVGAVRRGHPRLRGGQMTVQDFADLPHALVSPGGGTHGQVDDVLAPLGLRRHVAITVSQFLTLPFLIGSSDMVGVLPKRVADRMAETAGLTLFPLPFAMEPFAVCMLALGQVSGLPDLAWIRSLLEEVSAQSLP
jgi:DNA-binding transcriptional LysR family regulator